MKIQVEHWMGRTSGGQQVGSSHWSIKVDGIEVGICGNFPGAPVTCTAILDGHEKECIASALANTLGQPPRKFYELQNSG